MQWDRIADVNLNRLNESLKFLEDYIRFSIEQKTLLSFIRKIRKKFLNAKKSLPQKAIISSRKSDFDLGRAAKFDDQDKRANRDLVLANFSRAKEAARTLEEISRAHKLPVISQIKDIRFALYDLEKKVIVLKEKEFDPRFYAVLDEKYLARYKIDHLIRTLVKGGVTMLQLRIKTLSDKRFLQTGVRIANLLKETSVTFIINNRIDIAQLCNAHGVHLGQDDITISRARKILGDAYIIGVSVHTVKQAVRAQRAGADYLGFGAIYPTLTKSRARVRGLKSLRSICQSVSVPVIGIGGITTGNYRKVLKAGAAGVALSSGIFEGHLKNNISALTGGE